nr:MAG TPA: Cas system-associated protein [Caudoviricetes sp.]
MLVKNKLEHLFLEDRAHENRYGLHASAILASDNEFCFREQVLSLFYEMNQGEQLPIKALKVFAQGNAMHEKWYKLFKRAGIDVAIERSLFLKKYDLSFTIDALLNLFNEEIICDVKSQNSFAFKKSKGHPSGEKQVNFYLWALSKYTGVPHRKGFVLVDSKDDQEIRIVPVKYNKEKVVPYVERLKAIQDMKKEFMESKELPKRKCTNCDTKRASQCNMRDACFNIGKGRIKLNVEKKS